MGGALSWWARRGAPGPRGSRALSRRAAGKGGCVSTALP